ncbi:sensor domain-containing diguanylate cyclase [Sporomusa sp. KB1]|jgi:diguanylate cyclase (GGDEF)-like protein|uniref:GGDEF domain-containing protein n=1 Tax=Sporomusa sp. KB1 TaxID=943346 RepID=UPI00119D4C33|nr:sensor domain-containing diguanylate cyclase [Sporomusa sp. KB1]TWH45962.1 diguanylate cyclase (GGDEF)-like protein [Sporomusa sp. KB1]
MSASNGGDIIKIWGDPATQLQLIIRRMGAIAVLFSLTAAVLNHGPQWPAITGLASVYILYNMLLCWRQAKPRLSDLAINLMLCAGLTVVGARYSNILYYLLLMRMVLMVGRDRAMRLTLVIAFVYVTAQLFATHALAVDFWLDVIFNVISFALLSGTAVYMCNVVETQCENQGQIAELIRENAHHYELAHTDQLTGLLNHRAYLEKTADISQYILLIVDIDHFKQLNDAYGHLFGDQVLEMVGRMLKMSIRSKDMAFRYGGEEFALVLPSTSLELGLRIAERLRFQVANCDFVHKGGRVKITISIGVARKSPNVACQDAFSKADSALYRAKRQGRNQCAVF